MKTKLHEKIAAWIERRGGCRTIYRPNDITGEPQLYLKRYYIVKCRFFELMIHQFFMSDRGSLHNHPWASGGKILSGGYYEWVPHHMDSDKPVGMVRYWRNPGHIGYRGKNSWHKVELAEGSAGNVYTLFATGPRVQSWGFFTKNGFMNFRDMFRLDGTDKIQDDQSDFTGFILPRKKA
jgi:hypothetical protein